MRFYSDENFPLPVVSELRRLGHDLLTAFEDGRANKGIHDDVVLARSHRLHRVLLTINRSDFRILHESGREHSGIVICTFDIDFIGQAARIDKMCLQIQNADGQLIRVNRRG